MDNKSEERKKFDQSRSFYGATCPDCGLACTHPKPGCGCPGGKHIMEYHHTCPPQPKIIEVDMAQSDAEISAKIKDAFQHAEGGK